MHGQLLADRPRVDAYARAIAETVRPGDVVVDIGTGTGILSLLAAKAGARRVFAIESEAIGGWARKLAHDSGFGDVITVIEGIADDIELPEGERGDVLVTETIGPLLLDEDIERLVRMARRQLLKPGAREIPRTVGYSIVPVELPPAYAGPLELAIVEGFDVHALADAVRCSPIQAPYHELTDANALSAPVAAWEAPPDACPTSGTVELAITRAGHFHGLALLLFAQLGATARLDTRLGTPSSWWCPVLPVGRDLFVEPGDKVVATVLLDSIGARGWNVRIERGGRTIGESHHAPGFVDTILGMPPLESSIPKRLMSHALAEAVIDRVNGKRSVAEIIEDPQVMAILEGRTPDPAGVVLRLLQRLRILDR
jgi:protein arginine N-methyltransferase 1